MNRGEAATRLALESSLVAFKLLQNSADWAPMDENLMADYYFLCCNVQLTLAKLLHNHPWVQSASSASSAGVLDGSPRTLLLVLSEALKAAKLADDLQAEARVVSQMLHCASHNDVANAETIQVNTKRGAEMVGRVEQRIAQSSSPEEADNWRRIEVDLLKGLEFICTTCGLHDLARWANGLIMGIIERPSASADPDQRTHWDSWARSWRIAMRLNSWRALRDSVAPGERAEAHRILCELRDLMPPQEVCPICLEGLWENLDDVEFMTCNARHIVHSSCHEKWSASNEQQVASRSFCPLCLSDRGAARMSTDSDHALRSRRY